MFDLNLVLCKWAKGSCTKRSKLCSDPIISPVSPGSGGGKGEGAECSPAETEDPGSIPGVDSKPKFLPQFSATPTLDVEHFFSSLFPLHLALSMHFVSSWSLMLAAHSDLSASNLSLSDRKVEPVTTWKVVCLVNYHRRQNIVSCFQ